MKKCLIIVLSLLLAIPSYAQVRGGSPATRWVSLASDEQGRARTIAVSGDILTFSGNTLSLDVIGTVQADTTYWRKDGGNTPPTADWNLGTINVTTTGTVKTGILQTNNWQNSAGTESFIWDTGNSQWYTDEKITSNNTIQGANITSVGRATVGDLNIISDGTSAYIQFKDNGGTAKFTTGYDDATGDYKIGQTGLTNVNRFSITTGGVIRMGVIPTGVTAGGAVYIGTGVSSGSAHTNPFFQAGYSLNTVEAGFGVGKNYVLETSTDGTYRIAGIMGTEWLNPAAGVDGEANLYFSVYDRSLSFDPQPIMNLNFTGSSILSSLTISADLIVNGGDIGIAADTDLIQLTSGVVDINGNLNTSGDIMFPYTEYIYSKNSTGTAVKMMRVANGVFGTDMTGVGNSQNWASSVGTNGFNLGDVQAGIAGAYGANDSLEFFSGSAATMYLDNSNNVTIGNGDLIVDGGNIGITADTDLLQLASGALTVNGDAIIQKSGSAPTLTIQSTDASDPTLFFNANSGENGIKVFLDQSESLDELNIVGQTADVSTTLSITSKDGYAAIVNLSSGSNKSQIIQTSGDILQFRTRTEDKGMVFTVNDGGVLTDAMTIDGATTNITMAAALTAEAVYLSDANNYILNSIIGFHMTSSANLSLSLGDNAGSNEFRILDSDLNTVATIDSNGNLTGDGDTDLDGSLIVNTSQADKDMIYSSVNVANALKLDAALDMIQCNTKLRVGTGLQLTIATGVVTASLGYHDIDTEGDIATDDLDTISGGIAGQILIIRAESGGRTVVCKDGTGNLAMAGDFTLDNVQDKIMFLFTGANWEEVSRSDNGA